MISEKELKEIREILFKSENPLFFFDDDPDGLCSYLLLRRAIDKGKGVVIKSSPVLSADFLRKVDEYCPDVIFVLDKPDISQDFIDKVNVPLVWIDHHPVVNRKGARYYNPRVKDNKDRRPTSYWCYKVVNKDLWIAMIGVVGDWNIPEFSDEFIKKYPGLLSKGIRDAGDALFESKLGELVRIFSFILKGRTSDVNKCVSILTGIRSPYEILSQESSKGKYIYMTAESVKRKYDVLLESALKNVKRDKILFFSYPKSKMSFTGDLSNELLHRYPDKIVVIARDVDGEMKMSFRSSEGSVVLPPILSKSLEGLEGYGGGHDHAAGGCVAKKDFDEFFKRFKKYAEKGL